MAKMITSSHYHFSFFRVKLKLIFMFLKVTDFLQIWYVNFNNLVLWF